MKQAFAWWVIAATWACAGAPPREQAQVSPNASAAPALPRPAPSAEVERRVWTTAPDTDTCTEYPARGAPQFSQFDSQPACEEWVAKRRCRPGMSCNDGCNTVGCDGTGMQMRTTLLACELEIAESIEFRERTAQPSRAPDWNEVVRALQPLLLLPSRKLRIIGIALPREAASKAARSQLARKRAEVVASLLGARGLDRDDFVLETGDPSLLPYRNGRVMLRLDPDRLQPEEYDSSTAGYQNLCWVKYPRAPEKSPAASSGR